MLGQLRIEVLLMHSDHTNPYMAKTLEVTVAQHI